MSTIKLFNIKDNVEELESNTYDLERQLQEIIEKNMVTFFGVKFLASEFTTTNGGRIDSLGIDEDNCPVIFEYKRSTNENVINQGLFYLDWLMDHKADFKLLVMDKLGKEIADKVEWSVPRLICIASDFTKYDEYAVKQINRNIELVRYKKFGQDLLMFEGVSHNTAKVSQSPKTINNNTKSSDKTVVEKIELLTENIKLIYDSIVDYIMSLGEDISLKELKYYLAFKKIKNFICLDVYPSAGVITLWLKIDPSKEEKINGFSRDVTNIGHFGTGNFEISIRSIEDFEKAKEYILKAYNQN